MSRISFVALIFSGISLVCLGVMRLIFNGWVEYMWWPLGLSVLFLSVVVIRDLSTIREFLTMKTTKNGMNMGLMILLVLGIIVMINFIGVRNSISKDLTAGGLNSLSDQSVKLLNSLDDDIKFTFFYAEGETGLEQERTAFRELIRKYQDASSKTQLEYVDMNKRPDKAEEFDVKQGGGVVFVEYKGRKNRIDRITEQEISQAIIKVTKNKKTNVYFVQGHGEADLYDANTARGLASLRNFLEGNQYQVKTLNLFESGKVPKDADILAIIGPVQTMLTSELVAVEEYMARGGSVLVAVDPEMTHGMDELFSKVRVKIDGGYVGYLMLGRIRVPETIGMNYSSTHQITKVFKPNTKTVFRFAAPVSTIEGANEDIKVENLVSTLPMSRVFDSPSSGKPSGQGPHALVVGVSGKLKFTPPSGFDSEGFKYGESEFKMVVAGDTDYLRNQLVVGQTNNHDLALNTFAYLSGDDDLISIRPPAIARTKLNITETKLIVYKYAFVYPLPLVLLAVSIFLGIRRRNS